MTGVMPSMLQRLLANWAGSRRSSLKADCAGRFAGIWTTPSWIENVTHRRVPGWIDKNYTERVAL